MRPFRQSGDQRANDDDDKVKQSELGDQKTLPNRIDGVNHWKMMSKARGKGKRGRLQSLADW